MATTEFKAPEQNGHGPQQRSDVDQHFACFRWLYENAKQNWYIAKAKDTYESTKQGLGLEPLLNPIEERVYQASNVGCQYAAPLYADYFYPKADYLLHSYVFPGIEHSKLVLEKGKGVASAGGTIGVGCAVVGTQMTLITSAAIAALFLDGIILTKQVGTSTAEKAVALEKTIEQRIHDTIERSRNLAKIPAEKFNEFANSFLDIVNAVLDNHLHLPIEEEDGEASESSNIGRRVSRLARRVLHALKTRANDDLIQPAQQQFHALVEQLRKSLTLVDTLKKQRSQLQNSLGDFKNKLTPSNLSESMSELWARVEAEAQEYKISPEEALIRSIRRCAYILNDYLKKLREQTNQVLPASSVQYLENASAYVEELNASLEHSKDIYGVKDEVLQKAKQKLDEITGWTSNLVGGKKGAETNNNNNNGLANGHVEGAGDEITFGGEIHH